MLANLVDFLPRTISSVGRAPASHAGGHWFKSSIVHHSSQETRGVTNPSGFLHCGCSGMELATDRHSVATVISEERQRMADRKKVAEKDGAHKTNRARVVRVDFLAPDYQIDELDGEEIGPTGRLKVLRIAPSDQQSPLP